MTPKLSQTDIQARQRVFIREVGGMVLTVVVYGLWVYGAYLLGILS